MNRPLAWVSLLGVGLGVAACLPTAQNPLGVSSDAIYSPDPGTEPLNTNLGSGSHLIDAFSAFSTLAPGSTVGTNSQGEVYVNSEGAAPDPDADAFFIPTNLPRGEEDPPSDPNYWSGLPFTPSVLPTPEELQWQLRGGSSGTPYGSVLQTFVLETLNGSRTYGVLGYFKAISASFGPDGRATGITMPGWITMPAVYIDSPSPGRRYVISGSDWGDYTFDIVVTDVRYRGTSTIVTEVFLDFTLSVSFGAGFLAGHGSHFAHTSLSPTQGPGWQSDTMYVMNLSADGAPVMETTQRLTITNGGLAPLD